MTEFLDLLALEDYSAASVYLVNEAISSDVEDRLGDIIYSGDLASSNIPSLLETFCRQALCGGPYRIVGPGEATEWTRGVVVRFTTTTGIIDQTIEVSVFEDYLSIGSLPPDR